MKIKLADGLPYHDTMVHPKTGLRLRAVYQRRNGSYVWPVIGASGDDDGGSDNDTADGDADTDADDGKGDDGASGAKDQKKDTRTAREIELETELAKVKTHRSAADKSKAALQKELDDIKAKDLTELQKAQADAKKFEEESKKTSDRFRGLALTNAFLTESQKQKIQWHDPEVAQAAIAKAIKDLEVDEDSSVAGMDAVVKKLAKDRPFLVNSAKDTDKEEEDTSKGKHGASGSGVGSGSNGGKGKKEDGKLSAEELRAKFPALRR